MYLDFFGLNEKPFSTNPDPRYIYLTNEHKAAIAKTRYAIKEKLGIAVIYGDVGTGKSSISRLLYNQLRDDGHVLALMTNPRATTENQFLRAICYEYGVPTAKATLELRRNIQKFLLDQYQKDLTVILMIDEANLLPPFQLEILRQILNYESERDKLIQLILFGQNDLRARINRKKNLKNRISMVSTLDPVGLPEMIKLIRFRLLVAGRDDETPDIFTDEAYKEIFAHTSGIPRTISILCDNACLKSCLQNKKRIDADIIKSVAEELDI